MTPLEWFSVGVGVVSVLGVWLTGIAWWHGRRTNQVIKSLSDGTQAMLERMDQRHLAQHGQTQGMIETLGRGFRDNQQSLRELLERMDRSTKEVLDRMDQAAEQRQAEIKAILARRTP